MVPTKQHEGKDKKKGGNSWDLESLIKCKLIDDDEMLE